MIDQEKLQALRGEARIGEAVTLSNMSYEEMIALKDLLDAQEMEENRMHSLGDINLEHELMSQYAKVKKLQTDVLIDDSVPANQRAQVANAVASTLQQLIKMQVDLDRESKLKLMEGCLIESIKTLPEETKVTFFEEYERRAKHAGLL